MEAFLISWESGINFFFLTRERHFLTPPKLVSLRRV
jgi:hypothetical protein